MWTVVPILARADRQSAQSADMVALVRRLVEWLLRTFGTLLERLATVGFIYSGVVLAAQTFIALLPLCIVLIALLPTWVGAGLAQTLRDRLGLSGETDQEIGSLIASRSQLGGLSVISVVVVLASATSFTRALQRVYELSWGLPRLGLRGSLRGVVWLLGFAAYWGMLGLTLHYVRGGVPATALKALVSAIGAVGLWWWTPYILLMGRVRLRALVPCALVTGVVVLLLGWASAAIVPRTVRSNERRYGTIGVIFAVQSWLVVVSCTIVAAAVIGAVAAQTTGPLGVLARGSTDPEGWRKYRRGS
jgi:membrane protein